MTNQALESFKKKGYVQNLPTFMNLCERIYLRMLKLLPDNEQVGELVELKVQHCTYRMQVLSSSRFTTEVSFEQLTEHHIVFNAPKVLIRVYHDARLAEVVSSQQLRQIKPSYHYPNDKMLQKDEKYQLNAFLLDWLDHCLSQGLSSMEWNVNDGLV